MFYKKEGFPEEGNIVLCTVKKVDFHSVFVDLDEYKNKEGMIHISEIAPGRIRNIRDYVREGKKIICKVLRINQERGHIDLSLRRVSKMVTINKNEEYKQEQKAEKILEILAKELKINLNEIYKKIGEKIIKEYGLLNSCFQDVSVKGISVLKDLGIDEKTAKVLANLIKERIKPKEVKIDATLILKSNESNGIEVIKNTLKKAELLAKEKDYKLGLSYISAPKYKISITSLDYKDAEKSIEELSKFIIEDIKKNKGQGEFLRNA